MKLKLLLSALLILLVTPSQAVEAVLTDDTSFSSKPTPGRGGHPHLNLGEAESVYLKFDLAAVLPGGVTSSQVAKATVRLWVNKVTRPGACIARAVQSPWREENRVFPPPVVEPPPAVSGGGAIHRDARKFIVLDVTDIVRSWLDGAPNHGIVIRGANLGVLHIFEEGNPGPQPPLIARFDSKENTGTGRAPMLQVVLQNPAVAP